MKRLRRIKGGQDRVRKVKHQRRHRSVSSFNASMCNTNTETLHCHHLRFIKQKSA